MAMKRGRMRMHLNFPKFPKFPMEGSTEVSDIFLIGRLRPPASRSSFDPETTVCLVVTWKDAKGRADARVGAMLFYSGAVAVSRGALIASARATDDARARGPAHTRFAPRTPANASRDARGGRGARAISIVPRSSEPARLRPSRAPRAGLFRFGGASNAPRWRPRRGGAASPSRAR